MPSSTTMETSLSIRVDTILSQIVESKSLYRYNRGQCLESPLELKNVNTCTFQNSFQRYCD